MMLKDKVVIVTGASKGLGVGIARRCAAEGARVVVTARSSDLLNVLVGQITDAGGQAMAVPMDVARLASHHQLVDQVVQRWGRIDGLVNNAGVNFVKPMLETTESEWDHIMNVDLKGSFFLSQACARVMVEQRPRGGSIVQIASVHTVSGVPGAGPYDAAKHGMVGFTKAAAVELAPLGVRVNVLSPGLCRTEIWKDLIAAAPSEEACLAHWNANIPAQRLIDPEEIGHACVFLLSDRSSCITGANIMADCGMTSQLVSREPYAARAITGQ